MAVLPGQARADPALRAWLAVAGREQVVGVAVALRARLPGQLRGRAEAKEVERVLGVVDELLHQRQLVLEAQQA